MLDWHEWFEYRPEDGSLLWKKCTSKTGTGPNQPGKVAGCMTHRLGYPILNLHKRTYLQHRIVWEMHYGPVPEGLTIDHIDRDKANNRLDNLRLADIYLQNTNKAHPNRCPTTGQWLPGASMYSKEVKK